MAAIAPESNGNRGRDESRLEAAENIVNACGNSATYKLVELTAIPYDGTEPITVEMKVSGVYAASDEWHNRPA